MDWYDKIEQPIRQLVRLLRNNGINTECSCGHEMYIQCQCIPDGTLWDVHELLFNWLHEHQLPLTYSINIHHEVIDGHSYSTLDIQLPKENPMIEYTCDRCGKHFYKSKPNSAAPQNYDLCSECYDSFLSWMKVTQNHRTEPQEIILPYQSTAYGHVPTECQFCLHFRQAHFDGSWAIIEDTTYENWPQGYGYCVIDQKPHHPNEKCSHNRWNFDSSKIQEEEK